MLSIFGPVGWGFEGTEGINLANSISRRSHIPGEVRLDSDRLTDRLAPTVFAATLFTLAPAACPMPCRASCQTSPQGLPESNIRTLAGTHVLAILVGPTGIDSGSRLRNPKGAKGKMSSMSPDHLLFGRLSTAVDYQHFWQPFMHLQTLTRCVTGELAPFISPFLGLWLDRCGSGDILPFSCFLVLQPPCNPKIPRLGLL